MKQSADAPYFCTTCGSVNPEKHKPGRSCSRSKPAVTVSPVSKVEGAEKQLKVMRCLQDATGYKSQPDDLVTAARLVETYGSETVIGVISFVHSADPTHFWVDKVVSMEDLERHMETLQKQFIGYCLKNKARTASDDPVAKLRRFWANDIGGERFREEVQRRFSSQLPCPDCCPGCEGEHYVMSKLTGMKTLFCRTCLAKKEQLAEELQVEVNGILV
jgi:hypothetical protein